MATTKDDRPNLHLKVDEETVEWLDGEAERLSKETQLRATRSDVVRRAVQAYRAERDSKRK